MLLNFRSARFLRKRALTKALSSPVLFLTVAYLLVSVYASLAANPNSAKNRKKRDPFVALVHSNGKMKTREELFQKVGKRINVNVVLTAIIWDEERPLVMIDGKIYSPGEEVKEGVILHKVHPNSVELRVGDEIISILLRNPNVQWLE